MEPRWPRLPKPTVAWSSAEDDDLDRDGFVVSGTEASLEWHEARELDETREFDDELTPDELRREGAEDVGLLRM